MTVLNPTGFPLPPGAFLDTNHTQLTVDMMVADPVVMVNTIAKLVASNRGFFLNQVLRMPGMTVNSFVAYQDVHPEDLFLDSDRDLAPRQAGSQAPLVGDSRRGWKVAEPQSLSGRIKIADEVRQENKTMVVDQLFQRVANSFALRLQTWGLAAFENFVAGLGGTRTIAGEPWRLVETTGMVNSDPMDKPLVDIAKVDMQFIEDMNGVEPDTVILNPRDMYYLRGKYGKDLPDFWKSIGSQGLNPIQSVLRTEGSPLFLKAGQPGVIAYQEPLNTEQYRIADEKSDGWVFEAKPVFVVNDATSFVEVSGVNATS